MCREFPGGPVVRTLHFHFMGHGFDPWLENQDPACHMAWPKNKKNKNKEKEICSFIHSFIHST